MRQGLALYRAGDFEKAAKAFARVPGAEGAYNQGDALLMHGAYDQAIASFDRALGFRPDWKEAQDNEAIVAKTIQTYNQQVQQALDVVKKNAEKKSF